MREVPKRAPYRRRTLRLAVACWICVLTSALFAAPAIAEIDFGHGHPEETCPHVHELDSILARVAGSSVERAEQHLPRLLLIETVEPQVTTTESACSNPIRGPPGTFLF